MCLPRKGIDLLGHTLTRYELIRMDENKVQKIGGPMKNCRAHLKPAITHGHSFIIVSICDLENRS